MSSVSIYADEGDEVRHFEGVATGRLAIRIGEVWLHLPPAVAERLRDTLTAALNEPRTSGGTDVSG